MLNTLEHSQIPVGVVVYYKDGCPYCDAAREKLNVICEETPKEMLITTKMHEEFKRIKWSPTNKRQTTVPYIFCDGELIGGHDDLIHGDGIQKLQRKGFLKGDNRKRYFTAR